MFREIGKKIILQNFPEEAENAENEEILIERKITNSCRIKLDDPIHKLDSDKNTKKCNC